VEPRGPRNVGSVARALKNFGMSGLVVVNGPRLNHQEATAMAVNAGDLLRSARTPENLSEAIADATFVVATTAKRRYRLPTLRPREAGERIVEQAARGRVAILFGREDHGLDDAELRLAHETIAIETAPDCRALNISQAVLLVAYEVWLAAGTRGAVAESGAGRLITTDMRDRLETELLGALEDVGIMHDGNDVACEQSIQRLMTLGPMQTRDARVLFALARRIRRLMQSLDSSDS
jgi:TrmH family RNA methyltransferase